MKKRFDNISELNNIDILNIERVINLNPQPVLPSNPTDGEICFFNSKLHIYSNSVWKEITQSFVQDVSGLNLTQNGAYIKLQPDSFGGCRVSMRGNGDSAEYSILANKTGFGQYGTGEKLIIENFTGNVLSIKDNFIGISEIEPQRELHITSSFGEHMRFDSIGSSQYQNKIEFYRAFDNNNDRRKIAEISCHRQLDGGFFQIQTRQNNGSLNSGIFLDCSNNLGINKTNPAYTLDVSGNINFSSNLYKNGSLVNIPSFKTLYFLIKITKNGIVYSKTELQQSLNGLYYNSYTTNGSITFDLQTAYTNLYSYHCQMLSNPDNTKIYLTQVNNTNINNLLNGNGLFTIDTFYNNSKQTTDLPDDGDYIYSINLLAS